MIKSMTGFGRSEKIVGGRDIAVEIRSVNHRYFDYSSRISRGYGFLDAKLKSFLQDRVARGKLDLYVSVETLESADAEVLVNHSLASGYIAALRDLQKRYGLRDDLSVMTVARYADLFTVHQAPEDEEEIWTAVRGVAEEAFQSFSAMRQTEGSHLKDDFLKRTKTILELVGQVEERSPKTVTEYREKLLQRLHEMLTDVNIDEQRILTEAAVFADKVSVAEETVRLRSHISQFHSMLETGEAIGRKLDFLVQEMNREANTIGSKCVDAEIAHLVVDMKAEIEKIREQVQNVE
ncbi:MULTISPECIES: YicC/YloC family endoribonuclease [Eubacteriales]|uniref:YicC/YloC family endoribonuclease n=1 Tax=Caproicibacter fermentans TaxID=2576756 RepID=UPI000827E722|nr:YicC/YloC family endoribonuclease [Caproicibacter fermentans]OCN02375.1 YicC family protein [Clostridium sp. W14A]